MGPPPTVVTSARQVLIDITTKSADNNNNNKTKNKRKKKSLNEIPIENQFIFLGKSSLCNRRMKQKEEEEEAMKIMRKKKFQLKSEDKKVKLNVFFPCFASCLLNNIQILVPQATHWIQQNNIEPKTCHNSAYISMWILAFAFTTGSCELVNCSRAINSKCFNRFARNARLIGEILIGRWSPVTQYIGNQ